MANVFATQLDRGAHFHKCDFQVHTPRDANWAGEFSRVVTDEKRTEFAEALVIDARRKGLRAIAITDHHDLCLWPFVRDAAGREVTFNGKRVAPSERLIVFPGVELTLSSPPCQALLLLDPGLSDAALQQIWGALGITPIPGGEPSGGDPEPLRRDLDLNRIYTVLGDLVANPEESDLSRRRSLAGRFILLPHVHGSGHKTLMRRGQSKDYIEMPCVGGYIEGCLYADLREGDRNRLEGRALEWGNRSIGVFQTSDSRRADRADDTIVFPTLGAWPTWVKWTEPTAEALRQACLARDSRISHLEPTLPKLRVLGVEVSDSEFLGSCSLWLNPQFTAFIGGRGTGKSSLLEYIRWGLCDDPVHSGSSAEDFHELPDFQNRRKALIEKTLKPRSASITVYYEKFGVPYSITRSSTDTAERVVVSSPDGHHVEMRGEQVRREFPVIAYAQKQLSIVGTLPEEVRRLVTDPVRERLVNIERQIVDVALPTLRAARQRWLRVDQLNANIKDAAQQLESKNEQLRKVREGLTALGPEDTVILAAHDAYVGEFNWVEAVEESIRSAQAQLTQAVQLATTKLSYRPSQDQWPHHTTVLDISRAVDLLRADVEAELNRVLARLTGFQSFSEKDQIKIQMLRSDYARHQDQYRDSLARAANNEEQLSDLQALELEISEIQKRISAFSDEVQTLTAATESETTDPWKSWEELHLQRATILEEQAKALSIRADHAFRVTVRQGGNPVPVRAKLQQIVNCGRNIRSSDDKIRWLTQHVVHSDNPLRSWGEIVDEFRRLAESRGSSVLPSLSHLEQAGFTAANLVSLRDGLEMQFLEDVRYLPLADAVVFEFTFGKNPTGEARYIPFQDASPGQQATVLLKALLAQDGPPLLIDQPEEDLDNEQVNVVADHIRRTKHHRQVVFVSHNANLVVNGDAELVACFGYRTPGDQTSATVVQEGSIDYEPVRNLVTSVMEGGRAAFDLRRQKYNF